MRYRTLCLALVVGWFSSPMATAQQIPQVTPEEQLTYTLMSAATVDAKVMWEDVEIFRRILDRAIQGWAGKGQSSVATSLLEISNQKGLDVGGKYAAALQPGEVASLLSNSTGHQNLHNLCATEGNYLKGYGVVFTATLPWDSRNPVTESPKSAPKPLSEWDRVRNELRGVKVEADAGKTRPSTSLADVVLIALADNGRHFSQLGENERVTVAITLRPAPAPMASIPYLNSLFEVTNSNLFEVTNPNSAAASFNGNPFNPATVNVGNNFRAPLIQSQPNQPGEAQRVEAANFVHLGDQRLKLGRYQEAADAYQKAVAAYQKIMEQKKKPGTLHRDLVDDLAALANARTKLAQAYYSMGNHHEATRLLQMVAKDYEAFTKNSSPQAPATPARKAQVGKLIISAPKRLLDQVGTGKISREEFKKQVTLDFWDAPGQEPANPAGTKPNAPTGKKH